MTKINIRYILLGVMLPLCLNPAYALDEKVDTELKLIWHDMKSSLVNRDIEKAIGYYHPETKQYYRDVYTAVGDKLPQVARELMGDIQPIYIKENEAKYRLLKKESYGGKIVDVTYFVYFVKDSDGKWKVLRY
jgi:hypothetical protein